MEAVILVVDDVEQVRNLVSKVLTRIGSLVLTAETPAEAISIVKKGDVHIDLIFLDILLPGLNGYELLKIFQDMNLDPPPKICMMSQKGKKEDVAKAIQLGCSDYIIKPIYPDSLITKTKSLLGKFESAEYAKIEINFPAHVLNQAIEPDLLVTEITEDGMTVRSTASVAPGTLIQISSEQLSQTLEIDVDFNMTVRECRKIRIGRYFIQGSFVGLSEEIVEKIRSLAIRGVRSLNYS